MQWTIKELDKLVKFFNKKYFNNEITRDIDLYWSRKLFNATEQGKHACEAYATNITADTTRIVISTSLANASYELMRNTLVHEMIHAWQFEHDPNWKNGDMHNSLFLEWCEKLNNEFNFIYKLAPTATSKEKTVYKQTNDNCGFYVYSLELYEDNVGNPAPIGCFIKFLYKDEIQWLKNKGFKIKYYSKLKPKPTCIFKSIIDSNSFKGYYVGISVFKKYKINSMNFDDVMNNIGKKTYKFDNTDFNYETGIEY